MTASDTPTCRGPRSSAEDGSCEDIAPAETEAAEPASSAVHREPGICPDSGATAVGTRDCRPGMQPTWGTEYTQDSWESQSRDAGSVQRTLTLPRTLCAWAVCNSSGAWAQPYPQAEVACEGTDVNSSSQPCISHVRSTCINGDEVVDKPPHQLDPGVVSNGQGHAGERLASLLEGAECTAKLRGASVRSAVTDVAAISQHPAHGALVAPANGTSR